MVVKKSEFARIIGVSPARISQYIASGILRKSLLSDGRLDLEMAKREVGNNLDPIKKMDYELREDVQKKSVQKKSKVSDFDLGIEVDLSANTKKKKRR